MTCAQNVPTLSLSHVVHLLRKVLFRLNCLESAGAESFNLPVLAAKFKYAIFCGKVFATEPLYTATCLYVHCTSTITKPGTVIDHHCNAYKGPRATLHVQQIASFVEQILFCDLEPFDGNVRCGHLLLQKVIQKTVGRFVPQTSLAGC
jgi:hypothetical protein